MASARQKTGPLEVLDRVGDRRLVFVPRVAWDRLAQEDAARCVFSATEVDLASDFDPGAHFFGERRVCSGVGSRP